MLTWREVLEGKPVAVCDPLVIIAGIQTIDTKKVVVRQG